MREYAGKVLMVVENQFPRDSRVKKEALKLTANGYKISVISLANNGQRKIEDWNSISIYRLPSLDIFEKTETEQPLKGARIMTLIRSSIGYAIEYVYFTIASFVLSVYVFFKEGFDVIHAHNPPDTIFTWAALYKLFGKKLVFDHHDLSPEMYQSRYKKDKDIIYRCLLLAERLTCFFADRVIATNLSYKAINIQRNKIDAENIFVVRNGPDLNRVSIQPHSKKLKALQKTIIGYVGYMNPQDGVDYLLRALHFLKTELGRDDFYAVLIGQGDDLNNLKNLAKELLLTDNVFFTGYIPDKEMLSYLSTADICVSPDPKDNFTNHSTWIKILEYMTLGKPIVAFDLKETRYSARDAALYVTPNDELEFARAIQKLMDTPNLRKKMGAFGRKRVEEELCWEKVSDNLLSAYSSFKNSN